jgi:hypothetical protein
LLRGDESQQLLGDEQVTQGDRQNGNGKVGDQDADPGQVVTDLAVFTELAVFHRRYLVIVVKARVVMANTSLFP